MTRSWSFTELLPLRCDLLALFSPPQVTGVKLGGLELGICFPPGQSGSGNNPAV